MKTRTDTLCSTTAFISAAFTILFLTLAISGCDGGHHCETSFASLTAATSPSANAIAVSYLVSESQEQESFPDPVTGIPTTECFPAGSFMEVRLFNPQTGQRLRTITFRDITGIILAPIAFSRDSQRVLITMDKARIYDVQTGTLQLTLPVLPVAVSFSPDGRTLAAATGNDIAILDAATGQEIRRLSGHTNTVFSVSFSGDGRSLVSGGTDSTVRVWDLESGTSRYVLTGHSGTVVSTSFAPNGAFVASAGEDRVVRIWDAQTGNLLHTLEGSTKTINAVAISPDSSAVASASGDGTVRAWNAQTGALIGVLNNIGSQFSLSFVGDSNTILTTGPGDDTRLWDIRTGNLIRQIK